MNARTLEGPVDHLLPLRGRLQVAYRILWRPTRPVRSDHGKSTEAWNVIIPDSRGRRRQRHQQADPGTGERGRSVTRVAVASAVAQARALDVLQHGTAPGAASPIILARRLRTSESRAAPFLKVVLEHGRSQAGRRCRKVDGRVVVLAERLGAGDREIEAGGRLVLPGGASTRSSAATSTANTRDDASSTIMGIRRTASTRCSSSCRRPPTWTKRPIAMIQTGPPSSGPSSGRCWKRSSTGPAPGDPGRGGQ